VSLCSSRRSFFALFDVLNVLGRSDPGFGVDVVNRRLHAQRVALGEQAQVLAAHSDFRPKTFIQHLGNFDILTPYQLARVPLQQPRAGSLYGSVLAIDNRSAWDTVRENAPILMRGKALTAQGRACAAPDLEVKKSMRYLIC
jgi:hypothetical protein